MRPLSNFAARDVESAAASRPPTWPRTAARAAGARAGEGVHVYDSDGKRYIEGLAGLWCTGLGYGNAELVEAAREQMSRLSFTHLFGGRSHEPAIALAEKIKAMAPAPTSKVFFTNSGSEANDTQIKLAWYYNNARGQPKKQEDHRPHRGLSRHHGGDRQPVGPCRVPCRLRPADGARAAHRLPALLASTPSPARARRSTRRGSPAAWRR